MQKLKENFRKLFKYLWILLRLFNKFIYIVNPDNTLFHMLITSGFTFTWIHVLVVLVIVGMFVGDTYGKDGKGFGDNPSKDVPVKSLEEHLKDIESLDW